MKLGVFGDVHLTKNMRSLQDEWNVTSTKSIYHMYDKFDELDVEMVVCLGDFFDAPRIEAKHMQLVLPILNHINAKTYPTYLLLGNHEIDNDDSNILEFLSAYDNITPVTSLTQIENMIFIPYNVNPAEVNYSPDNIVFTHHDIYGSELAGGKTKAFFGIDPSIFKDAMFVMNGHVHLKSTPATNILNAGSILVSQQGELRVGDYPSYYVIDTRDGGILQKLDNTHSMIYLSIGVEQANLVHQYDYSKLVLRVDYDGELPDSWINTLHTSWRKRLSSIESSVEEKSARDTNFDMKNYLVEFIRKDVEVSDDLKESYITIGLELLS